MVLRAALLTALLLSRAAADDGDLPSPRVVAVKPQSPGSVVPPPAATTPPPPPHGTSWFALPFVFWLPETRLGFAAAGGIHFHLRGAERPSSVFLVGAYTLNRQSSVDLASDLTLPGGTVLSGRVRAVNFPDAFYGIGPFTQTSARESYTRRWAQGMFAAEVPLGTDHLRAGPRLDLRAERVNDVRPGGLLASGTVEGASGYSAVGLGGSAAWDTRDSPIFPHRGELVELWVIQYPEELGHHREFNVSSLEGRLFRPVLGTSVLGVAAYVEQAFGDVPFTLLPKLGSTGYLRGWREGRYRDQLATAAEVELRVPVWDRFGAVLFGSTGEVARDAGALQLDALRFAAGAGVRFRLTPEGTNIRFDVALSDAGAEVYLLLLEAF